MNALQRSVMIMLLVIFFSNSLQNWNLFNLSCRLFPLKQAELTVSGTAYHRWEAVQFFCSFPKDVYFCFSFCSSMIHCYRLIRFRHEINAFICTLYMCSYQAASGKKMITFHLKIETQETYLKRTLFPSHDRSGDYWGMITVKSYRYFYRVTVDRILLIILTYIFWVMLYF
jgi:hypothetical protein